MSAKSIVSLVKVFFLVVVPVAMLHFAGLLPSVWSLITG